MLGTWSQESSEGSYDWIFPPPVTARNLAEPAVEYDQRIPASKFPAISDEFWPKTASLLRISSPPAKIHEILQFAAVLGKSLGAITLLGPYII